MATRRFCGAGLFAAVVVAMVGCQAVAAVASSPTDVQHVPKIKVALYRDNGCRGGGAIHMAWPAEVVAGCDVRHGS